MHAAESRIRSIIPWKLALLLGLCGLTAPRPADCAELLSVAMQHDDSLTRVVFEFDARAGYRLERSQAGAGSGDLWVTLAARAPSMPLPHADGFIDRIQLVQTADSPAVVQVTLSEPGLQVHDRVLVSPPRLVFEVRRRNTGTKLAWEQFMGRDRKATPLFASVRDPRPAAPAVTALRDVRVGSHPEFSRVVFELDNVTAYRIEPLSEQGEIVVRLGASATTHELTSPSEFIGSVHVEARQGGSVAIVRVRKKAIRLSELTLANPNRIVIDIAHAI